MENLLYTDNFQVFDKQVFDKHVESMMVSLAHRLEVARATNNSHLVKLLEQEQQQIADSTPAIKSSDQKHFLNWIEDFKQAVTALFRSSKPKIHYFSNGNDRWWYTIDPETGRYIYAESEAELQLWLKEHR
jgi:hypothetical protein